MPTRRACPSLCRAWSGPGLRHYTRARERKGSRRSAARTTGDGGRLVLPALRLSVTLGEERLPGGSGRRRRRRRLPCHRPCAARHGRGVRHFWRWTKSRTPAATRMSGHPDGLLSGVHGWPDAPESMLCAQPRRDRARDDSLVSCSCQSGDAAHTGQGLLRLRDSARGPRSHSGNRRTVHPAGRGHEHRAAGMSSLGGPRRKACPRGLDHTLTSA